MGESPASAGFLEDKHTPTRSRTLVLALRNQQEPTDPFYFPLLSPLGEMAMVRRQCRPMKHGAFKFEP